LPCPLLAVKGHRVPAKSYQPYLADRRGRYAPWPSSGHVGSFLRFFGAHLPGGKWSNHGLTLAIACMTMGRLRIGAPSESICLHSAQPGVASCPSPRSVPPATLT